jgi:diacylglycerol kinase (ATP)
MSLPRPRPVSEPPPQRPARAGLLKSFRHAYEGLIVACGQRNMKLHVVSAVLVCLVGSGIRLGLAEKVSLIFCVMLVFFAEILNTALEALVDLHTEDFRQLAKTTKDAAAAAVLVLAMGTVVIFAAICVAEWDVIASSGAQILRQAAWGLPLAAIVGALLVEWRRPRAVDHALFVAGAALWAMLWGWTVSYVFTALAGGLLYLSWRAAARRKAA